ncbi:MAG: primosomal protein N' [Zetaproteobacteria bacterium]|nr:primosomal protein N' [Pseudobdellovibrionaceae bacterium]
MHRKEKKSIDINNFEVSLPLPVHKNFTYSWHETLENGVRVVAPVGRRLMSGVIIKTLDKRKKDFEFEIKPLKQILDSKPFFSPETIKLAQWLSSYYLHPLGEVFKTMAPPKSAESTTKKKVSLSTNIDSLLALPTKPSLADLVIQIFSRRNKLNKTTFETKLKQQCKENGLNYQESKEKITKSKLIIIENEISYKESFGGDKALNNCFPVLPVLKGKTPEYSLNSDQEHVINEINDDLKKKESPAFLLHGVTGSGKTEVYLKLIEQHIFSSHEEGKAQAQALVLVPEIALTPQMTKVFEERFPGQVLVVHSGLTDKARWENLQDIQSGKVSVLIGARSAVFAPFAKLRLIIVDEEHDNSYKQTTKFSYNGRDVAVVRAKFEKAFIVLGSATPSLESYWNAQTGKYKLLRLSKRALGNPLPQIDIISVKSKLKGESIQANQGKDQLLGSQPSSTSLDPRILKALSENLKAQQQSIVLVNRRGYAYYLIDKKTQETVVCPNCSITLTVHKNNSSLTCHYCGYNKALALFIKEAGESNEYLALGYGSENCEATLKSYFPSARIARLDSDISQNRESLESTLEQFRKQEIDILVGTQILAKGHDFPKVTLMILMEVDDILNFPDLRAGERTFQLLVQAAGRVGRNKYKGKVLVQTVRPEHFILKSALNHDYFEFVKRELMIRKAHGHPPFGKLIHLEMNGSQPSLVKNTIQKLSKWLEKWLENQPNTFEDIKIIGPYTPAIEKIRARHRQQILFSSPDYKKLNFILNHTLKQFSKQRDIRLKIDIDPQSMM